jgi:ubiquinone/menaquinone biosynthesis C-methylase UbiE
MKEVTLEEQSEKLYVYEKGYHALHLIHTGTELGLFDKIHSTQEGVSPQALADEMGLHEPYVRIWCQTAHHLEILDCDETGRFKLAPHMDTLLVDRNHPFYFGHKPEFFLHHLADDLKSHASFLRSGESEFYDTKGREFSRSAKALSDQAIPVAMVFMVMPMIPGVRDKLHTGLKVLDVGCGSGRLMIQMAKAYPNCSFSGIDMDRFAVEDAQRNIQEAALQDRVSASSGDASSMDYDGQFDLVTMASVLHEIQPDIRTQALTNCQRALRGSGSIVIFDFSYPEIWQDFRKPEHSMGIMDQFFEMAWGTKHLSSKAREKLLTDCGFNDAQTIPLFGGSFELAYALK